MPSVNSLSMHIVQTNPLTSSIRHLQTIASLHHLDKSVYSDCVHSIQSSNLLQGCVIYSSPPHMSNDLPVNGSAERKVAASPFCLRGSLTDGYNSKEVYPSLGIPKHKPYPESQSSQRLSHQERRSHGLRDDSRYSDKQSVPPKVGPIILSIALLSS